MEPLINLEEDPEDKLPLSHLFINKARPSASSSLETPLDSDTPPSSKRQKLMTKERRYKKSAAYSSPVMEEAKALQASLGSRHPSFIKFLTRSHVTKGFWMGLPVNFCRMHLPKYDLIIKLEDENGAQYETKFLAHKEGLSGGWEVFSQHHDLQEGDALVFRLVRKYKFKVHIVRNKNDLDHRATQRQLDIVVNTCQVERNLLELAELCVEESFKMDSQPAETDHVLEEGEKSNSESGKEVSSPSLVDSSGFSIVVNGCPVDSEIPSQAREKYYKLCCAQKSYLHAKLLSNINRTLAAGIILGTVEIVDAIQACSISSSETDLKQWEKILQGFKIWGMDIDFLLERIRELLMVTNQYQESEEAKRHCEIINEENQLNEKIASLETRLTELKEAKFALQSKRENLELHLQECSLTFQQIAMSPW